MFVFFLDLILVGPGEVNKKAETDEDNDEDLGHEEDEDGNLEEYFEIELNEEQTGAETITTTPENDNDDEASMPLSERRFRCKTCRVLFLEDDYKMHRTTHPVHFRSQKKLLNCRICQLDFRGQPYTAYLGHIAKVHKNAEGKFPCPQNCQAAFGTWGHLNQHMYKHGWKRPFQCKHCEYTCTTQVTTE